MILGMKVRKPDLHDMLKFHPKVLEFHFSDSDLNLELDGNFEQRLIVHCYEYFERKLLDIASLKETNQVHSKEKSLELIQKAIDKTLSLNEHFLGKPTLIVHPGGYSLYESSQSEIEKMQGMIVDSVQQLDFKNVTFLLENMPPYAWFFGGRWNSNVFLSADEMQRYCAETGLSICYDLCHSHLYCNKNNLSILLSFFFLQNSYSIEPVDIWNLEKQPNQDNSKNEIIENENLLPSTIFNIQNKIKKEISIDAD